jgi:predicted PurR-regulated permease PerM
VAVAIVALAWLAWRLLDVLIVVFGALVVAVALRTLAAPLHARLHMPPRLALAAVVLSLIAVFGIGAWLVGEPVGEQISALRQVLPRAFDNAVRWLERNPIGGTLLEVWDNAKSDGAAWSRVASLATMSIGAVGSALLIIAAGIYLAADPGLYRRGVLHLLPHAQRARADEALVAAGAGLSRWLLGQGVSMLVIGTMTAAGLWLLDVPLALTLGVIAGVLAFVPFFGAVASGVLIVLLAFTQAPDKALYALVLVLGVQQIEEFVIQPFVHRWSVRLPPALGLMSVLIFGLLFGPLGALFATPLMVVVMVLVQRLYVDAVVDEEPAPAPSRTVQKLAGSRKV